MQLHSDSFAPLNRSNLRETTLRPSTTYWQDAWQRLKKNKLAMISLYTLAVIITIAIIGPWLSGLSYSDQDLGQTNKPPSAGHWFGTDN
ncbi:MAG: dppC [Sporomusa sp.]|nr:dppC [Sporomusa sp.]